MTLSTTARAAASHGLDASTTRGLNSVGTSIGPWVGGLLILSATTVSHARLSAMSIDELQAHRLLEASSVKLPYICIAVLLGLLGFGIAKFNLPVLAELEDPYLFTSPNPG